MTHVYASSIISASVDQVWKVVRDFNALPAWHPSIAESRIEEGRPADQVGCVRAFRLKDGGFIREQLLVLSDYWRLYTSPSPRDRQKSRMLSSA